MTAVTGLSRIRLITACPDRLALFYESAFGFARTAPSAIDAPSLAKLLEKPGAAARALTLRLGEQEIELVGFHPIGRDVPFVDGWSPLFQHFAIVVADMAAAYTRLSSQTSWSAITIDGPQMLPPASGGVNAFKFRDPEGHPLELLAFKPLSTPTQWKHCSGTTALGIDHSAISVADTARSVAFYTRFGLNRSGGSFNVGPAQEKLDRISNAQVEVTALEPRQHPTPHLELLCYRGNFDRDVQPLEVNDIAATELVFATDGGALQSLTDESHHACLSGPATGENERTSALFRDPDGHLFCVESA